MKKNKSKSYKLPAHFKNFKCTEPCEGVCPICYKCGRVAGAAYIPKNQNIKIWWCNHGKRIEFIERFEEKLYDR